MSKTGKVPKTKKPKKSVLLVKRHADVELRRVDCAAPDPVYPKRDEIDKSVDKQLRLDSGSLKSTDPLVAFLYHLLRDELPAGVVEGLALKAVKHADALYSNGFMLQYAENLAARLTAPTAPKQKKA